MTKMFCDKCKAEVKEYYLPIFDGDGEFRYGLCEGCCDLLAKWMAQPPSRLSELVNAIEEVLTEWSLSEKSIYPYTSKSIATIRMLDVVQLQCAYIDYMECEND